MDYLPNSVANILLAKDGVNVYDLYLAKIGFIPVRHCFFASSSIS